MRVLVIAPSWIGDLVMSQCLYKKIRALHPGARIDVMAPKWCLGVLERMPEADGKILMPVGHGKLALGERYRLGRELRAAKYDAAYVLPNSFKSALIPFFAKIPVRRGWIGESRYFVLTSYRKNKKDFPLLTARYASLAVSNDEAPRQADLGEIPDPALITREPDPAAAREKFGIDAGAPALGLCPGAEYGPAKKWPPEYYAAVAARYLAGDGAREVWIFGSEKDRPAAAEVTKALPEELRPRAHTLAGLTSIAEAADLLAKCRLVLCNDSGLMHVSAAAGARVAAVFGSTSTAYTPPAGRNALLVESAEPCHPCFKKQCRYGTFACLRNITPDEVWAKITARWEDLA